MITPRYTLIVGNVGQVYNGNNRDLAVRLYTRYRILSQDGCGSVAHESVVLLHGDEIIYEYEP